MKILSIIEFIREFFRVTWYSVSSKKFYPDLYLKYRGFGIKYITTILAFTTLIYLILAFSNFQKIKNYLNDMGTEDNPLNFILDWPEMNYEDGVISWNEEGPHIIKNRRGKDIIAIDPAGKLPIEKRNRIPVVLLEKNILVNFLNKDSKGPKARDMAFSYQKVLGKESRALNPDSMKDLLISWVESFTLLSFLLAFPLLTIGRLILHLYGNLFGIIILYLIFLWMGLKPKLQSVTRVVLFTGAAAEILSCLLLLFVPALVNLSLLLEYWATILAVYTITRKCKPKGK